MNDIERYFNEFSHLKDEMEAVPETSEAEFLDRLHERISARRRRTRALTFILSGIAAAAVLVISVGKVLTVQRAENPALLCAEGYMQGMESLLKEVSDLESDSMRCREMGISSVISGLMASSESFAESLDGLDDRQRTDAVRVYCGRQMERVRELYRECIEAYERDRNTKNIDI